MSAKSRKRVNRAMRERVKWRRERNKFEEERGFNPVFDALGLAAMFAGKPRTPIRRRDLSGS